MPLRIIRRSLTLAVLVAAVFVPVASANTPPTCSDVSATVQNTDMAPVSVKIVAACTDPDPGTTLVYAINGGSPISGGYVGADPAGFVFTPSPGFAGTVTFPYVAHDGTDVSRAATATITVLGVPVKDEDADRDGVIGEWDDCPELPGTGRPDGCPDRDGHGISEREDTCPDAAGNGSFDGCPAVVDSRELKREARRVARRLGQRWDRAAVRQRAWATHKIVVTVQLPSSAVRGRGLRVGIKVFPVRHRRDGPLGSLLFGKGVPCEVGHACRVTLRLKPDYFPPARHRSVRLQLLVSPQDTRGWIGSDVPLDLSPRH